MGSLPGAAAMIAGRSRRAQAVCPILGACRRKGQPVFGADLRRFELGQLPARPAFALTIKGSARVHWILTLHAIADRAGADATRVEAGSDFVEGI